MAANPMHQFKIYRIGPEINLGGVDISFNNSALFMLISVSLTLLFLFVATKRKSIIPSKIQILGELSYSFVAKMINETAGSKAKPFFPFLYFCIFRWFNIEIF